MKDLSEEIQLRKRLSLVRVRLKLLHKVSMISEDEGIWSEVLRLEQEEYQLITTLDQEGKLWATK
jgi:hypothetical protein